MHITTELFPGKFKLWGSRLPSLNSSPGSFRGKPYYLKSKSACPAYELHYVISEADLYTAACHPFSLFVQEIPHTVAITNIACIVLSLFSLWGFDGKETWSNTIRTKHTMQKGKTWQWPTKMFRDIIFKFIKTSVIFWNKDSQQKNQQSRKIYTIVCYLKHGQGWFILTCATNVCRYSQLLYYTWTMTLYVRRPAPEDHWLISNHFKQV